MPLPRKELLEALVDAFTPNSFDEMLAIQLNRDRHRIITGLASFDDIVTTVLIKAEQGRWALDLIRGAVTAKPGNPKLKAFVVKYPDWDPTTVKTPVPGSYYQAVLMRGRRAFLKREGIRQALSQIGSTPEKPRVLAIDGDPDSGKTYSREFLNFVRENEPTWAGSDQRIIFIDTDDCAFEPERLAEVIGARLGMDLKTMPPDKGEQAPRRIPALVDWLGDGIQRGPVDVWWIILDGFRDQIHPKETHDLIRALLEAINRDLGRARLLLINYKGYLDFDVSAYILSEIIETIERRDIETFFKQIYTMSGKNWDDSMISQTVDEVLAQVEVQVRMHKSKSRLGILSVGLTNAANSLLA